MIRDGAQEVGHNVKAQTTLLLKDLNHKDNVLVA